MQAMASPPSYADASTQRREEEAEEVVALATEDGVYDHEFPSGKYRLGGDWVKSLPNTLEWFNERLRTTIFPAVAALFPEVVSDASVLRAHSVAILKYNSSHPRTDVHVAYRV